MKHIQSLLTISLLVVLLWISLDKDNIALVVIFSLVIGFISGMTILSFYLSIIDDVNKLIEETGINDIDISAKRINHTTPEIDNLINTKCEGT